MMGTDLPIGQVESDSSWCGESGPTHYSGGFGPASWCGKTGHTSWCGESGLTCGVTHQL